MHKLKRVGTASYHHLPGKVADRSSPLAICVCRALLPSRTKSPSPENVPDELDGVLPLAAVPVDRDGLLDEAEPRPQPDAVHLPEQGGDVGDVPAGPHEALDPAAGDGGHELHGLAVDAVGAAEPVENLKRAVGVAALLREVDEHELQLPRRQRGQRGLVGGRGGRLALQVLDGSGEEPVRGRGGEGRRGVVEAQGARGRRGPGGGGGIGEAARAGGLWKGGDGRCGRRGGGVGRKRHGCGGERGAVGARVGRRAWSGSAAEDLEAWLLMCGEEKGRRGSSQGRDGGSAMATVGGEEEERMSLVSEARGSG